MTEAIEFYVFPVADIAELARAAKGGNPEARDLSVAVAQAMATVLAKAATRDPAKCMCCEYQFAKRKRPPYGFGIVKPMFPDRTQEYEVIGCGICVDCIDRADLLDMMLARLRQDMPGATFEPIPDQ